MKWAILWKLLYSSLIWTPWRLFCLNIQLGKLFLFALFSYWVTTTINNNSVEELAILAHLKRMSSLLSYTLFLIIIDCRNKTVLLPCMHRSRHWRLAFNFGGRIFSLLNVPSMLSVIRLFGHNFKIVWISWVLMIWLIIISHRLVKVLPCKFTKSLGSVSLKVTHTFWRHNSVVLLPNLSFLKL